MALSEDQKAMLKLVSQPDTSYEDIAALMGLSVEEVRAKVDDALRQLDQGAEKAAEPPPPPPPKPEPVPEEKKPEVAARPAPTPAASRKSRPKLKLPEDKGARNALIAGGAVVLVLVLLLVTGVLGGDDDDGGGETAATTTTGAEGQNSGKVPTQAAMEEIDGSGVSGQALFGRAGKQVALLLRVRGLGPAPSGQSYTISIGKSEQERVPLVASRPNGKGEIVGSFRIAPQILGLLASGYDNMEVSLVPNDELGTALKAAQKSGTAPAYGGTELAAGAVTGPIVEAGEKAAEGS
ncbi:MAG TPA: hypothetical protein VIT85_08430 [Solirubrobacterales bacterium]